MEPEAYMYETSILVVIQLLDTLGSSLVPPPKY